MFDRTRTIGSALLIMLLAAQVGCGPRGTQTSDSNTSFVSSNPKTDQAGVEPAVDSQHDFYTVSRYDKNRDPADDLAATIARAKSENKRVILQVGGDWCGWCTRITDFMSKNASVRSQLEENFLVMKVTYPSDHAENFLSAYPKCQAYPHFFVLDVEGGLLASQGTGELEKGDGYDEDVFLTFLKKWSP